MRTSPFRWTALAALLFASTACALLEPTDPSQLGDYALVLPDDWTVTTVRGMTFVTRDGGQLQCMVFQDRDPQQAFVGGGVGSDVRPAELADATLATLRAQDYPELDLLENQPAEVAGREGFRLHFLSTTPEGLRYEHVAYGFVGAERSYLLWYRAPRLHYFADGVAAFEEVVAALERRPTG